MALKWLEHACSGGRTFYIHIYLAGRGLRTVWRGRHRGEFSLSVIYYAFGARGQRLRENVARKLLAILSERKRNSQGRSISHHPIYTNNIKVIASCYIEGTHFVYRGHFSFRNTFNHNYSLKVIDKRKWIIVNFINSLVSPHSN